MLVNFTEDYRNAVKNGEITNFDDCFDGSPGAQIRRTVLCQLGIEVKRCVEYGEFNDYRTLILYGHGSEYYEQWKDDEYLAYYLASTGHFLDEYIQSDEDSIRQAVMTYDPHYCMYRMGNLEDYPHIYTVLSEQENPEPEILEAYFEAYGMSNEFDERGLKAKLGAIHHKPSQLEKTMTEVQLYKAGSPLWAKNLTAIQARAIIEAHENLLEYDGVEEYLFKHVHQIDFINRDLLALVYTDIKQNQQKG